MNPTRQTPPFVLLLVSALFGALISGALLRPDPGVQRAEAGGQGQGDSARSLSRSFQAAARTARPSLLNITTERWEQRGGPFVRMLENMLDQKGGANRTLERSYGTGFIVDEAGVALTNHHVVENAKRVLVRLHDGSEVSARVLGTDPLTDLAVLELPPREQAYVPVQMGTADSLEVGDWVLAAGNPFGLDQTVTAGIVSAKGRSRMGIATYEDFIQTDAAINPGNSGGPLLDLSGRVVGVTTAIASRSGEYSGIGFAIPIGMAQEVVAELRERGRVSRGWLGVGIQEVEPEVLRRLGYGNVGGALLSRVMPESPAAQAQLQAGDLIVSIDGQPLSDGQHLSHLIAEVEVGKTVKLEVLRERQRLVLEALVVERPDTPTGPPVSKDEPESRDVGISARLLTPELARFFGFDHDPEEPAVVIAAVDPGSLAAQHGIRPGMILQQVERSPIRSLEDLELALKAATLAKRGILLRVWDGRSSNAVLLR
ncbi:MAG TPA: hypothetical protein DEA08_03245 [Planctomycetes bacterium]|nr:hypothetical protein [Planctomycetota bacterium]